jgi:NAD-dependent SIR2 family protein deacetylase
MPEGVSVFTSNVDGQFQKAGFSSKRVHECHGSIHHLQCLDGCMSDIWSAENFQPLIDEENCRLISDLPRCPYCGEIARPNILMFGDGGWLGHRAELQEANFTAWRRTIQRPVIIEIGAGQSIPTVRRFGEEQNGFLIRINPDAPELNGLMHMGFRMGGLEALCGIETALGA